MSSDQQQQKESPVEIIIPDVPYIAGGDLSTKDADIGIANMGPGADGFLLRHLAKSFGYKNGFPEKVLNNQSFTLYAPGGKKPVLFIYVDKENPEVSIQQNLSAALKLYAKRLAGKKVWVPTLGTSEHWITPEQSHNITANVLNSLTNDISRTIFLLAIPLRAHSVLSALGSGNIPTYLEEFKDLDSAGFWSVLGYKFEISGKGGIAGKGDTRIIFDEHLFPGMKPGDWVVNLSGFGSVSSVVLAKAVPDANGYSVQILYKGNFTAAQSKVLDQTYKLPTGGPVVSPSNKDFFIKIIELTPLTKYLPLPAPVIDRIPFHLDQVISKDLLSREPIAISLAGLLNDEIFNRNIDPESIEAKVNPKKKTRDLNHAFMIHLQGAWGDGKSTFLRLLEQNLSTDEKKWIIINFNAWQHQHIQPPWWTFLAEIFSQAMHQLKRRAAAGSNWLQNLRAWLVWLVKVGWKILLLWVKEYRRRFMPSKAIVMAMVVIFALALYYLRSPLYNFSESFFKDLPKADSVVAVQKAIDARRYKSFIDSLKINNVIPDHIGDAEASKSRPSKDSVDAHQSAAAQNMVVPKSQVKEDHVKTGGEDGKKLNTYLGLIAAVGTALGLLYSLGQFLVTPFFLTSPDDAVSFMKRSVDPMRKVKKHFSKLITNLNGFGYEVAIFIDDLDRCNDTFTVELLEGIQTLFRDKGVLYVVAGDRHWISSCFENHYKEYRDVAKEPGQKLGYLFLEKAFQLSIRLPNVSKDDKKKYWEFILSKQHPDDIVSNGERRPAHMAYEETSSEAKAQAEEMVNRALAQGIVSGTRDIQQLAKDHSLDEADAKKVFLRAMDKNQKDVKHLLAKHAEIIDSNPRSIIRLANQYTIYRNILTVEEQAFHRDKLFRWLVLQNKYPVFTDWLEQNAATFEHDKKIPDMLSALESDPMWIHLMYDTDGQRGGMIQAADVYIFTGGAPRQNPEQRPRQSGKM